MKNLKEYIQESLFNRPGPGKDNKLLISPEMQIVLIDYTGHPLYFKVQDLKTIYQKCGNEWEDQDFIDIVFQEWPEVEAINIEYTKPKDEGHKIYKSASRYEQNFSPKRGWKKW